MKHKIPSSDHFLKNVAEIIIKNPYAVCILPNRRSCRELRKYLQSDNGKIIAISDLFSFENEKIILSLIKLLKPMKIPFSTLYELSASLCSLLNELVLNKIDIKQLATLVPDDLQKYWNHTIKIIEMAVNVPEIEKNLKKVPRRLDAFLQKNKNIITVDIREVNFYARQMLKQALKNGIVVESDFTFVANKKSLNLLEFNSFFAEGQGIALAIKEIVSAQKSVLVISPNQNLTEIIKSELDCWNIHADDSQGTPFSKTVDGILISLVVDMMENSYDCVSVINVLKMSLKLQPFILELELFFRKLPFVPANFFMAFDLYPKDKIEAEFLSLLNKFREISEKTNDSKSFSQWLDICCQLASEINQESIDRFQEFSPYSDWSLEITLAEFAVFIKNYVLAQPLRTVDGYTPNVLIMGALEAQLLDADHIIITDVNDGSWCKPLEKNDFWMTQSMVKYFGMQSAETKNGFLRDIFARLAHKENVLITRSTLANGIQQQRYRHFDYIAKNLEITEAMAHARTRERKREAVKFEIPVPDVSLRPRSFWVSDLDLLQENPYAFYAKNILKLPQLNTIRELKNVRGNYIHSVLEKFVKCNEWTIDNFLLTAQKILRDKWMDIGDLGLWFFRLDKISDFVLSNLDATKCWTEISGATSVRIEEDYDITIRCRVDRIDEDNQGNISIIDYKSGIVPSIQSVKEGKKLQLPIALIVAQKGGFGLRQTTIKELCYWKLSGKDAGAEVISIAKNSEELQQVNSKALETLKDLVRKYNLKGEGYEVNANSFYEKSYLHLARIKEWDNAE